MKLLRARQRLGKYVIERRLGEGGFAMVYQARDTIEGIRVALKIPHNYLVGDETLAEFRREAQLVAKLEHPNVLPLKSAQFIDGHFVIASIMGNMTLEDRLGKRISINTANCFSQQILAAVAYAHDERIVHCDVKPENFILFDGNRLRLTDFGVAQVAQKTLRGSGAGTLGYMAPEQAMGRPSFRSDVFALGLVLYRLYSGWLPEYPFQWPPAGYHDLQKKLARGHIDILRRAIELNPSKRFPDARAMTNAFTAVRPLQRTSRSTRKTSARRSRSSDWKSVRWREFRREYGKTLAVRLNCHCCRGPVAETMPWCPWCGEQSRMQRDATAFPQQCPRCFRGMKLDWHYCPWCFGPGFEPSSNREFSDARYEGRCTGPNCKRKLLMPFMRYCPWCRRKVVKKWALAGSSDRCGSCGWGIAADYWSYCPWCSTRVSEG